MCPNNGHVLKPEAASVTCDECFGSFTSAQQGINPLAFFFHGLIKMSALSAAA
jgi:hypothetical protein